MKIDGADDTSNGGYYHDYNETLYPAHSLNLKEIVYWNGGCCLYLAVRCSPLADGEIATRTGGVMIGINLTGLLLIAVVILVVIGVVTYRLMGDKRRDSD